MILDNNKQLSGGTRVILFLVIVVALGALAVGTRLYTLANPVTTTYESAEKTAGLVPGLKNLNVTLGREGTYRVNDSLVILASEMRAYFKNSSGDAAGLKFIYFGPTKEVSHLASGQVRQQIGLKLRAPDSCNTLYIMWRIEPAEGIVVSTKRNPGVHADAVCGADGYTNIAASKYSVSVGTPERGEQYNLRAEINDHQLKVHLNGQPVWVGMIPAELVVSGGQTGMRTDNGIFLVTPYWQVGD